MNFRLNFDWPTSLQEATAIIEGAAPSIVIHSNTTEPKLIAAVETDYGAGGEVLYGAAVVTTFPGLKEVERGLSFGRVSLPYHPELLFFREGEIILNALAKLRSEIDLIMVSGHGLAHPQLCGVACLVGLAFDKPTIGCARRLLAGQHRPLDETQGSIQPIVLGGREVGVAYRSKDGVKPIFVSAAHRCDLKFARDIVVRCMREFRLPEPLRFAHLEANRYRRRSDQINGPVPQGRSGESPKR